MSECNDYSESKIGLLVPIISKKNEIQLKKVPIIFI